MPVLACGCEFSELSLIRNYKSVCFVSRALQLLILVLAAVARQLCTDQAPGSPSPQGALSNQTLALFFSAGKVKNLASSLGPIRARAKVSRSLIALKEVVAAFALLNVKRNLDQSGTLCTPLVDSLARRRQFAATKTY